MRALSTFLTALLAAGPVSAGVIETVAGGGTGGVGDAATDIPIDNNGTNDGIGMGLDGHLYVSDQGNHRIWGVSTAGVIVFTAGAGTQGFSGDGGPASAAQFNRPRDVAADARGNVFVLDGENYRIRRIDRATGVVTTYAGNGGASPSGDGAPAASASLGQAHSIALDAAGNLYLFVQSNCTVRRIDAAAPHHIRTIAGTGSCGTPSGETFSPATTAPLHTSWGMAASAAGEIYLALQQPGTVWKISPVGAAWRMDRVGVTGISQPYGIALAPNGDLFITGNPHWSSIWMYNGTTTTRLVGSSCCGWNEGDNGTNRSLSRGLGIAVDAARNAYVMENSDNRVIRLDPGNALQTFAGNRDQRRGSGLGGGDPLQAGFRTITDLAVAPDGGTYVLDESASRIRYISPPTTARPHGVVSEFAGTGVQGFSGDGGPAAAAQFSYPRAIRLAPNGDLYVADRNNHRIRVIRKATGNVETFFGDGDSCCDAMSIGSPAGLELGPDGSVYVTSENRYTIVKIDPAGTGQTLLAGSVSGDEDETDFYDEIPAIGAPLSSVGALALLPGGNLLYVDQNWYRVRLLDLSREPATLRNFAGTGSEGYNGEAIPAVWSPLNNPSQLAVNPVGNVLIADRGNHRLRMVDASGLIYTVGGIGRRNNEGDEQQRPLGDGGPATSASVIEPTAVAWSAFHHGYLVAEGGNRPTRIRLIRDDPPVVSSLEVDVGTVSRGAPVEFTAVAADPETLPGSLGLVLELKANDAQAWTRIPASYDLASRAFSASYTPPEDAALGGYQVRVTASDGVNEAPATELQSFTVQNAAPRVAGIVPDVVVPEGNPVIFELTGHETDFEDGGADLDWTIALPDGAAIEIDPMLSRPDEDFFVLYPADPSFAGTVLATLRLTDTDGGTAEQPVRLTWLFTGAAGGENPLAPRVIAPTPLETIGLRRPEIVARNPFNPRGAVTELEFEIHRGSFLGEVAATGRVALGDDGVTRFAPAEDLADDRHYTVRVRGLGGLEPGAWSSPVPFRIDAGNDLPTAPAPVMPVGTGFFGTRPTFVFAAASDPEGSPLTYTVEVFADAETGSLLASKTGLTGTGHTLTWTAEADLEAGRSHYWRVRANDGTGDGPNSHLASFVIDVIEPPVEAPPKEGCSSGGAGALGVLGLLAVRRRRGR